MSFSTHSIRPRIPSEVLDIAKELVASIQKFAIANNKKKAREKIEGRAILIQNDKYLVDLFEIVLARAIPLLAVGEGAEESLKLFKVLLNRYIFARKGFFANEVKSNNYVDFHMEIPQPAFHFLLEAIKQNKMDFVSTFFEVYPFFMSIFSGHIRFPFAAIIDELTRAGREDLAKTVAEQFQLFVIQIKSEGEARKHSPELILQYQNKFRDRVMNESKHLGDYLKFPNLTPRIYSLPSPALFQMDAKRITVVGDLPPEAKPSKKI